MLSRALHRILYKIILSQCREEYNTAADDALGLPAELISEMMEVRTRRFETVTGFEDLELD